MNDTSVSADADLARRPASQIGPSAIRGLILALGWVVVVAPLIWRHTLWRDEVRALSLALTGDNFAAMLKALHGEGHPFIWYALLRGVHAVIPTAAALPATAFVVALATILLLTLRSPFRWPLLALVLLSRPFGFEYSVMARNYGISALLIFAVAAVYGARDRRPLVLGALLFLLANTNLHATFLVFGILILWAADLVLDEGVRWTRRSRQFGLASAFAIVGVALCFLTIMPSYNDAATLGLNLKPGALAAGLVLPAWWLQEITVEPWAGLVGASFQGPARGAVIIVMSAVVFGSLLGLVRRPAAFVAGAVVLCVYGLFCTMMYPVGYRHAGLWLVWMLGLYWIVLAAPAGPRFAYAPGIQRWMPLFDRAGPACLAILFALQVPYTLKALVDPVPFSRSKDLGDFIKAHPQYGAATIVADPDYLVEPVSAYVSNPTYLMRENRYGHVVIFTRKAKADLSLDDISAHADRIRRQTGRPVLILLAKRLDPGAPAQKIAEGYNWTLTIDPDQTARFLASTRRLWRFAPARSDESFDLYEFTGGEQPTHPGLTEPRNTGR